MRWRERDSEHENKDNGKEKAALSRSREMEGVGTRMTRGQ